MPKIASLIACMSLLGATAAMAAPMAVVDESKIAKVEPTPMGSIGTSTVYRITDGIPGRLLEFRKRILPKGSKIGLHPVHHDEVFYALSGTGEIVCDGTVQTLTPGIAIYIRNGSTISVGQTGESDFVVILAYPLSKPAK